MISVDRCLLAVALEQVEDRGMAVPVDRKKRPPSNEPVHLAEILSASRDLGVLALSRVQVQIEVSDAGTVRHVVHDKEAHFGVPPRE